MLCNETAKRSITLRYPAGETRRWIKLLVDKLAEIGFVTCVAYMPGRHTADPAMQALNVAEQLVFGRVPRFWDIVEDDIPSQRPEPTDLTLALGDDCAGSDLSIWIDGMAGLAHLPRLLIGRRVPLIEIRDNAGAIVAAGVPGIEHPDVLGRALDMVLARIMTLILMALDGQKRQTPDPHSARPQRGGSPLVFGSGAVFTKILGRLAGDRVKPEHWRVAIRPLATSRDEDLPLRDLERFAWLSDDGLRYYADPVLWDEGGRTYLFVEEFDYALGRGLISYTELDDQGRACFTPRPVITRKGHLSYPLMFRHEGEIYMMPENAQEGHLPLYRASRFPEEWQELAPLIGGIGLHDATLLAYEDAWWLLANEAREGGSSWDCLCLYKSRTPLGPFEPHPGNPVLVDTRAARSAGPVFRTGAGELIRPVQNCEGGYGRALSFARIDQLGQAGFSQHLLGEPIRPRSSGISGLHSYSRSSRLEAIDMLTPRQFAKDPR
ncbi:GH43_XynB-like domain containing protein [Rhabdaerophilaceae bacterium]